MNPFSASDDRLDELAPLTSFAEAQKNLELLKTTPIILQSATLPGVGSPIGDIPAEIGARFGSVSGLSPEHVHKAVDMTLQAAVLAYHHRSEVEYTEGALRWSGIHDNDRAWRGEVPRHADCSAFGTWCLWQPFDHFHYPDIVNGEHWREGYTGTLLQHGRQVGTPLPGDLIIYGTSWPGVHTAVYTGGGLCVSHGNSLGPILLPYNQMGIPILSIRRYI